MRNNAILRRTEVEKRTGLSRSSIYNKMKHGEFPMPIRLGPRSVGWLEIEIDEWIVDRAHERQPISTTD